LHDAKPSRFNRFFAQKRRKTRDFDRFRANPFQPEIETSQIRPPRASSMQTKKIHASPG
jgi:hypothetical protein